MVAAWGWIEEDALGMNFEGERMDLAMGRMHRLLRVHWTARRSKGVHPEDHPKGDQSWVFIGRTDAEAETPILWPPHAKT